MKDIYEGFWHHQTFAEQCLSVRNKLGAEIPYQLAPSQLKLAAAIEQQQKLGKPIRIVILKARQVFFSTGTAGHFLHRTAFRSGQHTMVIADEKEGARDIFAYYQTFQRSYQRFGDVIRQPALVSDKDGLMEWANGSWIRVQTARNTRTGRSVSVRNLHLSEYAFYLNARKLMTGLMQSVPDDPKTSVIVESTANGVGNAFHKLWQLATDPEIESDWIGLFFAWWEHPEYDRPLDVAPQILQESLSKEESDMAKQFSLSLEQLNWRRWAIVNKCENDVERFRQEYPSFPEEAFRASGRPRLSFVHLQRMPIIREALTGELEVEQLGPRPEIYFNPGERGALTLYRKPERGHIYTIGADTCWGLDANEGEGTPDPDWSVGNVLDVESGEQVAKLRARMEPAEFGRYLAVLGRWYFWAFLVPEVNNTGIGTVEELLRQQYPPAMLYHRRGNPDDLTHQQTSSVTRVGWMTSSRTRPQLISKLDRAIREQAVFIRDPHTLQECYTFVIKPNGTVAGQEGCHDDEVFALALAVVGIETFPSRIREQQVGERVAVKKYGKAGEQGRRGSRRRPIR